MEKTIDLEQLRTFALVLELGSFSAAAERLGLTQPAVSVQVKKLERALSVRLVERVGRRVSATSAGTDLLAQVPHVATAVANAVNAATFHAAGVSGTVRLGTGLTPCLYFLPAVLHGLRKRYPSLQIVVSTGNTEDYVRQIEGNIVDVALVTLPVHSRAIAATPVLEDDFVAICRRGTCQWPDAVTAEMLSEQPLVKLGNSTTTRTLVDEWLRQGMGPLRPPAMEFDSVEAIKAMVAAGLGCAVLPRMAVTGPGKHKDLEMRPLEPRLRRTLALILRQDKPVNRSLKKVLEAITDGTRVFKSKD